MSKYISLHNHSSASFLDGLSSVKDLALRAKELGMNALSITDHGNVCNSISFYNECHNVGIKPIQGCELYYCKDKYQKGKSREVNSHLIAIAKNNQGWKNLLKLSTYGY